MREFLIISFKVLGFYEKPVFGGFNSFNSEKQIKTETNNLKEDD